MTEPFRWTSPLGVSVIIFFAIGALWILIGILTVPLHKRAAPDILFVSPSTDTAYFGALPSELAPAGSPLAKFRTLLLTILAGFLLLGGSLVLSIAWFGLKQGQPWALAALAIGVLFAVAFWWLALLPYFLAGIRVGLGDLPPFIWVPTVLILPAVVLGWIGLR